MHLANYLGYLHRAELNLAEGFRKVADSHAVEIDIYHTCNTLAKQCEAQVAYAIGKAHPVGFYVDTFGTEKVPTEQIQKAVLEVFDLRPGALVQDLNLKRPIFATTAAYGHFGRELPDLSWESTDRAEALAQAVKG